MAGASLIKGSHFSGGRLIESFGHGFGANEPKVGRGVGALVVGSLRVLESGNFPGRAASVGMRGRARLDARWLRARFRTWLPLNVARMTCRA